MRLGPYLIDVVDVELELVEDMLGTAPANPETYRDIIIRRMEEHYGVVKPALVNEELGTLPRDEELQRPGVTVFHRDSRGVFVFDYHIKGYLKEIANKFKETFGITAMRDKVESYVYVFPRRVYVTDDRGNPLREPTGQMTRPLRAMTMQGPRSTIVVSEVVPAGSRLAFEVRVYQNGMKKGDEIRPDTVLALLQFGESQGLGQWRTGGWGRFKVVRFAIKEADVPWKGREFRNAQDLLAEEPVSSRA